MTDIKRTHFHWLDLLRFIAALAVLLSHSRNEFFVTYDMLPATQQGIGAFCFYALGRLGHEAVMVFFVLSGFLVGGRGLERILSGSFKKREYVVDRSARIMIPLATSILFFLAVCIVTGNEFDFACAAGNLLSLQGICCEPLVSPFWSLSYEVWFYILLLAISLVADRRRVLGLILTILCFIVFACYLEPQYLFVWFIGAAAYLTRPSRPSALMLVTSAVGIFVCIALWQISSDSEALTMPFKVGNPVIVEIFLALFFGLFIQQVVLHEPGGRFASALDRLGTRLAAFSYTLYLSHKITFIPVFKYLYGYNEGTLNPVSILEWISLIAISIMVAWLLYLISEKHTGTVKRWMKKRLVKGPVK